MDARVAHALLEQLLVLDVRERYEWEKGHIVGSVPIPIGRIRDRVTDLPTDRAIVVTCQIGQRSALAAAFLTEQGYEAHNLEGGLEGWASEGFELESSQGPGGEVVDGRARDLTGRVLRG